MDPGTKLDRSYRVDRFNGGNSGIEIRGILELSLLSDTINDIKFRTYGSTKRTKWT